jgi:hypothetical protein
VQKWGQRLKTWWQIDGNSVLLPFEAKSVGGKEGVKGEQATGKVTEDGDEASEQIMGPRGVAWQSACLSRKTMWVIERRDNHTVVQFMSKTVGEAL